ncbi:hypothetical protein [Gracilinema caldarium]|nr:hypothetical protein [Gracilinema caldarium]
MNIHPALTVLIPLIIVLAFIAAIAGLWPAEGHPYQATSLRGESVTIHARGLYYWDTVSSAAQMQANDLVTLALAVPLLILAFLLAQKGSLRGMFLLTGNLGFILYTYITMCFGAHFNRLFLVYVALFGLSLFAFILCLMSFDINKLPEIFTPKLPRSWIAGLLFFTAAFLTMAWGGRIAAALAPGAVPALDNTTSMFIQALDLAVIVPVCIIAGILLLRQHPWGYLLSAVGLVKFTTLGIAVSLMGLNMARIGVPISLVELTIFPAMAFAGICITISLLLHVKQ